MSLFEVDHKNFTINQVGLFLAENLIDETAVEILIENEVSGVELLQLNLSKLKGMGVDLTTRLKIMVLIDKINQK